MKYTKEFLDELVKKNNNIKDCLLQMHGQEKGNNYGYFLFLKNKFNLDTSHFLTKKELSNIAREKNGGSFRKKVLHEEIFIENSNTSNSTIKSTILRNNLIPYICECCGQDENWMGKKMPLILDHKNGINNDNRLENLRFLCSNCDSILETYKGKNRNKNNSKKIINHKEEISYQEIINKIKESNIDFKNWGWIKEVSILINRTPQYSGKFIKNKIPEIWEICKKKNNY